MCLTWTERDGQKGMNHLIPWLFPDDVVQNAFCSGGALGWFYRLLWTEAGLQIEGCGLLSSSQESRPGSPLQEESSILSWRGAQGLHEPQSRAVWGWATHWDGALRLPECGSAASAGAHGPDRGSARMAQAGVSLHTLWVHMSG